jgi:hypothetical protein
VGQQAVFELAKGHGIAQLFVAAHESVGTNQTFVDPEAWAEAINSQLRQSSRCGSTPPGFAASPGLLNRCADDAKGPKLMTFLHAWPIKRE